MVKADLDNIAVSGDGGVFLALLKTEAGDVVPIAIDALQARAIALGKGENDIDRPMTHDLTLSIMEILNAKLERIDITELKNDVFFAKLIIENRGIEFEIDARPSDALALAIRVGAPIFIAEEVVENHAFSGDLEDDLSGPAAEA
ncbi:MAG: bifunctional nuclease family protein [Trueperaceae bacterium]|nr:bifunctional nuclease family protein [Trueperaceae bacterium]